MQILGVTMCDECNVTEMVQNGKILIRYSPPALTSVSKPIWTAKSRCEPNSNESRARFTICPNDTPWRQAPYTFLKLYLSDIFKNIWKNTCRANQGKTSIKVLRRRLRITVNQMVKCIGCQKIWIFRNRIKLEVTKLISFWLTSSSSILTS